ncbi:hypothetical protein ACFRLW_29110 [Streptomyces sp. NPDC056728]
MIRLKVDRLPGDRDAPPVWLWSSTTGATPDDVDFVWSCYLRRPTASSARPVADGHSQTRRGSRPPGKRSTSRRINVPSGVANHAGTPRPHLVVEPFVQTWAVIVECHRRGSRGEDGHMRREFAWVLAPVASPLRDTWPQDVINALAEDDGLVHNHTKHTPLEETEDIETLSDRDRYRQLDAAASRTATRRTAQSRRSEIERYFRSTAAREAVMIRSAGTCENPN